MNPVLHPGIFSESKLRQEMIDAAQSEATDHAEGQATDSERRYAVRAVLEVGRLGPVRADGTFLATPMAPASIESVGLDEAEMVALQYQYLRGYVLPLMRLGVEKALARTVRPEHVAMLRGILAELPPHAFPPVADPDRPPADR